MNETVIACAMLEDEVQAAMQETGCTLPVIWVEHNLHEFPKKLHGELSRKLEEIRSETVLLAYSLCGNALDGLSSSHSRLVVPRFDDCIRMLLSHTRNSRYAGDCHALYYTGGWLRSENFLTEQYCKCEARLGAKKAKYVYQQMMKNYKEIRLLKTGAYEITEYLEKAEEAAELLGLVCCMEQGTNRILRKLFAHEWDEEFVLVGPGERLKMEEFIHRGDANNSAN